MHALLWPDLIVLCGGITEEPEKFMDKLHCEARLCVGTLRSEAGIVGAALATTVMSIKAALMNRLFSRARARRVRERAAQALQSAETRPPDRPPARPRHLSPGNRCRAGAGA